MATSGVGCPGNQRLGVLKRTSTLGRQAPRHLPAGNMALKYGGLGWLAPLGHQWQVKGPGGSSGPYHSRVQQQPGLARMRAKPAQSDRHGAQNGQGQPPDHLRPQGGHPRSGRRRHAVRPGGLVPSRLRGLAGRQHGPALPRNTPPQVPFIGGSVPQYRPAQGMKEAHFPDPRTPAQRLVLVRVARHDRYRRPKLLVQGCS